MRKIVGITGIRSEYDLFYGILAAIRSRPALEIDLVLTGAHLSDKFQYTANEIRKDGFNIIAEIESLLDSNTDVGRIKSAAIALLGIIQAISKNRPDFLLLIGDREEAMMGALAGSYMNIPVAHVCGGDIAVGNIDDSARHAITKLAHIHFPSTKESADRIIGMGEEPWRVNVVGHPGLDRVRMEPHISKEELSRRLDFSLNGAPYIVLIQHPLSTQWMKAQEQMIITMEAVKEMRIKTLIGYPNSDAGSRGMIQVIEEYSSPLPFVKVYRNLPRGEFVNMLRHASALIGNSSLGILEAPFLGLPVVNIGERQKRRQHAKNIIFVTHDKESIKDALRKALNDAEFRNDIKDDSLIFGDGHAGERIADILANIEINERLIRKDWGF